MAREYGRDDVRRRLVEALSESRTGLSGVEISARLGMSRITASKYLEVFAAEGLVRKRGAGGATVWHVDQGSEAYRFPDDYYRAQERYQELVMSHSEDQAQALVRSCICSGASVPRLMADVVVPADRSARRAYDDGRIGGSELALARSIMSGSIRAAVPAPPDPDPRKNAVLMAADPASALLCESAAAALKSSRWRVALLGDMSESDSVLLDLDLVRLFGRIWKPRRGLMMVAVFGDTEKALRAFAGHVNEARAGAGRNVRLVLCGPSGRAPPARSDLAAGDLGTVLQWFETAYEGAAR